MKHQKIKEALKSLKPKRSIWGFLGVLLFFILPEIIAFFYAQDIVAFAQNALSNTDDFA